MEQANLIHLTRHATVRSQQRGIRRWVISAVIRHADKIKHVGDNCISQFISEKKRADLIRTGIFSPANGDLVKGIVVISRKEEVVTVFHKKTRLYN